MTVEPWQLQTNSILDVDGSKGYVLHNSGGVVTVQRESGKIEQYTTESVAENGKVHEDSPVQPEPAPQSSNVPQPVSEPVQQEQPTQQPTDQPSAPTGVNDPVQPTTGENRQQTP